MRNLVEYAATFADDPNAIAALAGATEGAWQAFATAATFQLHKNLVANGLPNEPCPRSQTVENLLRLGYAIRLIDETACADPMYKDGSTSGAADEDLPEANGLNIDHITVRRSAEPIHIQQWLNDASGVCTHDFEPYAEHVLELITLDRLGVLPLMDALMGERPRTAGSATTSSPRCSTPGSATASCATAQRSRRPFRPRRRP